MAILTALIIVLSLAPTLPLAGAEEGSGFLVFRDNQPVGPELDVVFHAVVPDGVNVMSAWLHLYGTTGVLPVAAQTGGGGGHNHTLNPAGVHTHVARLSGEHNHSMDPSGEHDHSVFVYSTNFLTDAAKMSVTLPSHNHTYDSGTRRIDPYDFAPVVSNGHNHTVPSHSHTTLIVSSGGHDHVTHQGGAHDHVLEEAGVHVHTTDFEPDHAHDLQPGTQRVDGTRPSNVQVTISQGGSSNTLPAVAGSPDEDWSESLDLLGEVGTGIAELRLGSETPGSLEYVLVVEVDAAYGVLTGHSVLGPGGILEIPVAAPLDTLAATAFIFGDDLPSTAMMVEDVGNHTHVSSVDGEHNHTVAPVAGHTHLVSGGDHEHEGTVGTAAPPTDQATPSWTLPAHRHTLTWAGNLLTGIGNYDYGTVESNDHVHTVVGHDHMVTLNVSGNHTHDLSMEGAHTHLVEASAFHSHEASMVDNHTHSVVYHPSTDPTGGPTGVNASLDGNDVTADNGGPWALSEVPVTLPLGLADWSGPHSLNLTAGTEGEVEWVVLLELGQPVLISTVRGTAGDLAAHVPVPATVVGARVGVLGSPYVMPQEVATSEDGGHAHVTSADGAHSHTVEQDGDHAHLLEAGGAHVHVLTLNDTDIVVLDANGTVDLEAHSHTATPGFLTSSASPVVGDTGTHMHATVPHSHEMLWAPGGAHLHTASVSGNHTHAVYENGSHSHTMEGGEHGHAVMPGVHYDSSFPSPSEVDVKLGPSDPGIQLPGDGPRWWDSFDVEAADIQGDGMLVLSAVSATPGTLSIVLWFLVDSEAPEPDLIEAPDWVRPGDGFDVVVGVPEDIDPDTAALEAGPVDVLDLVFDDENLTITFQCQVPLAATEGRYDINVTCSDVVGNTAVTDLGTMGIDGTPPDLHMTLGEPNLEQDGVTWVTPTTPVALTVEDELSGPGGLEYAFSEEGPWIIYDPENDLILSDQPDGPVTLHYRGIDMAGNVAERDSGLTLDSTPPTATLVIDPSAPGEGADQVLASPSSLVSFIVTDGEGVGNPVVKYRTTLAGTTGDWRTYDRAFPVSTVIGGPVGSFEIEWRATDWLGNFEPSAGGTEVLMSAVPPVPSPGNDLFLPDFATASSLTIQGRVPGDVARLHYRMDSGSAGMMDIEPDTTFSFQVDLVEGPNVLIYALEDDVGNVSPWVVAGTVTLDTKAPTVTGSDPVDGARNLPTSRPTIAVHFSEPIDTVTVRALDFGQELDVDVGFNPGNNSISIAFSEDLPATTYIDVELGFIDMAGHAGSHELRFRTGESAQNQVLGYVFGLIAGLVIGALLVYFVTFRRKDEDGPTPRVDEMGVRSGGHIVSPESTMEWGDEEEEEPEEEEEEPEDEEEPEEDEETVEEGRPGNDDWEEDETSKSLGSSANEGDGEPEEEEAPDEEGPDDDEAKAEDDEEVSDDLADEIDRLLEGTGSREDDDGGGKVRELPDPDSATVDPGARF